jgi:hypothetical protein
MTSYWPFAPPDSDHENWDRFSDAVAMGELDPDGIPPARLPGRGPVRNFTNVAASLPPRPVASPSGRSSEATPTHGMPSDGPLSPPLGAVPFSENEEHP